MKNKIRLWLLKLLGGVEIDEYMKVYNDYLRVISINEGLEREMLVQKGHIFPVTVCVTIDLIKYDRFPNLERTVKEGIANLLAKKLLDEGFILIERYHSGIIPLDDAVFRGTVLVCRRDN